MPSKYLILGHVAATVALKALEGGIDKLSEDEKKILSNWVDSLLLNWFDLRGPYSGLAARLKTWQSWVLRIPLQQLTPKGGNMGRKNVTKKVLERMAELAGVTMGYKEKTVAVSNGTWTEEFGTRREVHAFLRGLIIRIKAD